MIHYLITELEATTGITDVVGDNIFTLSRLENNNVPALVLQMTGSQENESKGFHLNLVTCFAEVTAIHENPGDCWRLALKTVKALNGFKNDNVLSSQWNQWASDVFEADELFTITMTFTVQIKI